MCGKLIFTPDMVYSWPDADPVDDDDGLAAVALAAPVVAEDEELEDMAGNLPQPSRLESSR